MLSHLRQFIAGKLRVFLSHICGNPQVSSPGKIWILIHRFFSLSFQRGTFRTQLSSLDETIETQEDLRE